MSKKMRNYFRGIQPVLKMGRSKFDLSYDHKTSVDVGDIVPVYFQEIYPGDTFKVKTTFVCRTLSPYIRPVMDNLFMDIYYFFVPNRLVWTRWQEFMGENVSGYWKQTSNIPEIPQVKLPYQGTAIHNTNGAIDIKSVAGYLGINIGQGIVPGGQDSPATISELPFRGFALIYNEWFRNENFEAPVYINTGDTPAIPDVINGNAWSVNNYLGCVPKANKLTDYFTACLPAPQKGDAVDIPIGNAPVVPLGTPASNLDLMNDNSEVDALKFAVPDASGDWSVNTTRGYLGFSNNDILGRVNNANVNIDVPAAPYNLFALNNLAIGNINDLRFAFQLQKMLEKDARGGTRYVEYLAEHFGCISPDARLQRPEFLGGKRVPLQLQEVAQTSASQANSPQAQLAAYGATIGDCGFSKGFVEHGYVFGVAVIRQKHTYQQGIDKLWMRKDRYDFYDPVFANIGEQPVYKYEIDADSLTEAQKKDIFGYNEAWADLRFRRSIITGTLNSTVQSGFDIWHYGDYYANRPTLNNAWMKETEAYVDRTLSVPSNTAPNFIVDFYHKNIAARVLPVYSIPGLVDHH